MVAPVITRILEISASFSHATSGCSAANTVEQTNVTQSAASRYTSRVRGNA